MRNKVSERFYFIVFVILSIEIIALTYGKRTISQKNEENIKIINIYKHLLNNEKMEYFPLVNVPNLKSGDKFVLFSENEYRLIIIAAIPTIDFYEKEIHDVEAISRKYRDKAIFITLIANKTNEFKCDSENIYYLENPMLLGNLNKTILFITKSDGEINFKTEKDFLITINNILGENNQ